MAKFLTGLSAALGHPHGITLWEPTPDAVSHIYSEDAVHTCVYTPACTHTQTHMH